MAFSFGSGNNNTPFGGFGSSNNNTNTSTPAFGGFGSNNNNTSGGFGTGSTSGFGSGSGTLFGQSSNNATFGQNKSPFSSNTNTTSGGLFGSNTNTTTGFGSANTGGSMFGNASNNTTSAFGSGTSSGGGFTSFGQSNSQSNNQPTSFGASQNKPLFGSGGAGTIGPFGGSGTALGQEVPPPEGTNVVPFQPYTEKEATGTGSSVYQTITFQQPYLKYSLEELRLADYNGGRRFGTGAGQTGAFGSSNFGSSAFGGNTGGFGGNPSANASGGGLFGSNTNATFGGGSGGLFGSSNNQTKPSGLFGQQTSSTPSGGLFGTSNNATSGSALFGSNNNNSNTTTTTTTGGGLFGSNNNNNNAQKPGGLFGNTSNNTGGSFSFGNTNNQPNANQSGGVFGSTNNTPTSGGLFGSNNNQSNTSGGLFGNANNNNNTSAGLFGNKSTFGAPATQSQSSGGLFGSANTGTSGGLFGNTNTNNQNTSSGGLFGNTANNNTPGGGLFGNANQSKPGGLFGNTNTNPGGGLFGNTSTNNNNNNTGGLFGNTSTNNQQNTGGLFGNTSTNTGGGLFGNTQNNQNKPGGLFGNTGTTNQGTSLFGNTGNGLFGASQSNQQQQIPQQQAVKHASLLDSNPYGQSSIWTGLPAPTEDNSKPIFTPLTATKKLEESKMKPLATLRLNQSRYMTPPRRNGYGFSYSTFGSPSSAASTPGGPSLAGSMYGSRGWSGGSFGRSFNRSASVQNLRTHYAADADDIWKPNAFAPSHRNSSGSIKRLTIDRSIRNDLFHRPTGPPALPAPRATTNGDSSELPQQLITDGSAEPTRKLSKRVSFENTEKDSSLNGTTGALVRTEESENEETPPAKAVNGASGSSRTNGLQAVPEDRESHQTSSKPAATDSKSDPPLGAYYMKPSRQEIAKMPPEQRRAFRGLIVGREGCGYVTFDGAVDLNAIDLDNLFEKTVVIIARSITVYPNKLEKPPVGKGLNVPSTILLYNSWPRSSGTKKFIPETSGPRFERHLRRLKQMENTRFISYDPEKGWWKFSVDHYTSYGLDYDDDGDETMDQSELSPPPTSIEKSADASVMEVDDQYSENSPDYENDTFAFKKSVPGQFGRQNVIDEDDDVPEDDVQDVQDQQDDGSERSVYSEDHSMSEDDQSHSMPGSMPQAQPTLFSPAKSPTKPMQPGTPGKALLDLEGDWAEQLQRTISPRKQNRDMLRDVQSKLVLDKVYSPIKPKLAPQVNFRSSIDIMNSMFEPVGGRKANKAAAPDFEFPYSKRAKTFHPENEEMTEADRKWHASFKPHFTGSGAVLYQTSKQSKDKQWKETAVAGRGKAVIVLGQHADSKVFDLPTALSTSDVELLSSIPAVRHKSVPFSQLAAQLKDVKRSVVDVYNLAHVLFDEYDDEFTLGLNGPQKKAFAHRIRKDRLTQFLASTILAKHGDELKALEETNPISAALHHLTMHDVKGACDLLKKQKNFHLMLLLSQLDGQDQAFMDDMRHQINAWRDQKALSEISLDIRALYEICAGNVTNCEGKENAPVEDRAKDFNIAKRYRLDWLQSFGLGLFFGKEEQTNDEGFSKIEDAVHYFQARVGQGELPKFDLESDVMWSLLKIYAWMHADVESTYQPTPPALPADLVGLASPFDSSDLFTFYHAIITNTPHFNSDTVDTTKADQLAEVLAAELSAKGDITSAIYALIHLSDPGVRKGMIQDLLDHFAAGLPGSDTATTNASIHLWQTLIMDLKIPQSWLFMAKARYAASATNHGGDNISELRYLVAAKAWDQAHECLIKRVAPSFVVDEDWNGLLAVCELFGDDPVRRVADWQTGGAVFDDFGKLMTRVIAKEDSQAIAGLRRRIVQLGHRYTNSQTKGKHTSAGPIQLGRLSNHELEEHVAIKEMANALARLSTQGGNVGTTKDILEMPITQDVRAELTIGMAEEQLQNDSIASSGPARMKTRGGARQLEDADIGAVEYGDDETA